MISYIKLAVQNVVKTVRGTYNILYSFGSKDNSGSSSSRNPTSSRDNNNNNNNNNGPYSLFHDSGSSRLSPATIAAYSKFLPFKCECSDCFSRRRHRGDCPDCDFAQRKRVPAPVIIVTPPTPPVGQQQERFEDDGLYSLAALSVKRNRSSVDLLASSSSCSCCYVGEMEKEGKRVDAVVVERTLKPPVVVFGGEEDEEDEDDEITLRGFSLAA